MHLEKLLALAAIPSNWAATVVRRCAWCGRIADRDGKFSAPSTHGAAPVTTDGMCPSCACRALAQVAHQAHIRLARDWAASRA